MGYNIGHIKLTNNTVADDELLISSSHADAQTQLNIISSECSRDRAIINPTKTEAMILNSPQIELMYNEKEVPIKDSAKHLGLYLSQNPIKADDAISKSRKTIYSLMGTGAHGQNGINPIV